MIYLDSKRGAVLIITLWILAIITILAVGIGYRMGIDLKITGYQLYKLKALYIARAGINKAVWELENKQNQDYDYLAETWSNGKDTEGNFIFKDIEVGEGNFTISYEFKETENDSMKFYGISSEESKININTAPIAILSNLPGMTSEIAAAIIDWRDEKEFRCIEELLLVKDITPEIFNKIKNLVTVHSNGKININTADYDVLNVLLGPSLADKVVRFRQGPDGETGTEYDNFFNATGTIGTTLRSFDLSLTEPEATLITNLVTALLLDVQSANFRIDITAKVKQDRIKKHITCIVERTFGQPSKIRYWFEP